MGDASHNSVGRAREGIWENEEAIKVNWLLQGMGERGVEKRFQGGRLV